MGKGIQINKSFIICSVQRSGSQLLSEALRNTEVCGNPNEYFQVWQIPSEIKGYDSVDISEKLEKVLEKGTSANGVFGCVMMWDYFENVINQIRTIPGYQKLNEYQVLKKFFKNLHFIYLIRKNQLRQAISMTKAQQTKLYSAKVGQKIKNGREPTFNYHQLEYNLNRVKDGWKNWRRFFKGGALNPFKIVYEDFTENYENTILKILEYLEIRIPNKFKFRKSSLKQLSNSVTEDWIKKYNNLSLSNKKKKPAVALITAHGWIGICTPVIMTAKFLAIQGYQVDIYISEDPHCRDLGIAIPDLEDKNIEILRNKGTIAHNEVMAWRKGLNIRYKDLEFVENNKTPSKQYEWIIGYDPEGLSRAGLLSLFWRVPYIFHSLELNDAENSLKEAERWFSQKANLCLTQDRVRADLLSNINHVDRKKVEVSYNSALGEVLTEKKDYFRNKFKIPEGKTIVLAPGTLLPIHGIDQIIDSVKGWPEDYVLVIHGWIPDKKFDIEVKSKVELSNHRMFLSTDILASDEKDIIFQSADIGLVFFAPINTNYKFGAGSAGKLFDFMRAGVPIIGNDIPGMDGYLEGNGCGLVVKDAAKIGAALPEISRNYASFRQGCFDSFAKYEFGKCYSRILKRINTEIVTNNKKDQDLNVGCDKVTPLPAVAAEIDVTNRRIGNVNSQLLESDILIASFPRSGNTWARNLLTDIIFQIHNIKTDTNSFDDVEKVIPDIYLGNIDQIDSRLRLPFRLIKTHEKFDPRVQKTIYVFRKATDALCSYYHFCVDFEGLDPKTGIDDFCLEKCEAWIRHVDSYLGGYNRSQANICFISYEWLHRDAVGALIVMADFLGLSVNRQMCERAVENQSFQKHRGQSKTFYRRGVVGTGAEELDATTIRRIRKKSDTIYNQGVQMQAKAPGSLLSHRPAAVGFKVVHLCLQDIGGAGRAAYRLHKGFEKIGVDSQMLVVNKLTPDTDIKVLPPAEAIGMNQCLDVAIYDSPLWKKQLGRWQKLLVRYPRRPAGQEMFTDVAADIRLDKIKEIQEADIIHLHWVAGLMDYASAPAAFGDKPIVWTLHDMNIFTGGCHFAGGCTKYGLACRACPQLGSVQEDDLAAHIWQKKQATYQQLNLNFVCPSQWLANCAGNSGLLSRYPIVVIPNGLSTDIFKPYPSKKVRQILEIDETAKVVLFGADFIKNTRKGFTLLLNALKEFVSEDVGNNIILACFGNIPESAAFDLDFPILQLGYFNNEKDLALVYSAADVFVLPSLEDNLPNTVMEAMACGIPVVGFDVGGLPDMIDHKRSGFLVKNKDARSLLEGIRWVLSDERRRLSLSEKSRRKVKADFAHEDQAKSYQLLYQKLLSERRKTSAAGGIISKPFIHSKTECPSTLKANGNNDAFGSDTKNAVRKFTRVLKEKPGDIESLTALGRISFDLKRLEEAEIFFRRILDFEPLNSVAKNHLDRLGDYGMAPDYASDVRRQDYDDEPRGKNHNYIVSAIVSTYNAERFIRGCLDDLESQTMADRLEIIVIDSGSRQNERAVVEEFQQRYDNIKYFRTENRESVYAAWNRGIKIATGKYVTNANTDDRHSPDAFERMANILDRRPDIVLVYADAVKTETENEILGRHTQTGIFHWHDWDRDVLLNKGCFIGPQPMWRRSVHDHYGYFDESLTCSGDYEFWLRISQTFDFFHLKMPLGLYLNRPDSIEHRLSQVRREEDERILSLYRQAAENGLLIKTPGVRRRQDESSHEPSNHRSSPDSIINQFEENQTPIDQGELNKMTSNIASQPSVSHGDREDLIASLKKVLELYPNHAPAHHDLAAAYYQKGSNDKALVHFEKAVKIEPANAIYQKSLADFYYSVSGRAQEALEIYCKVLNQQPRNLEVILMAGHLSVALNKFGDAEEYYKRALEIEPWNHDAGLLLEKLQNRNKNNLKPASAEKQYADIQNLINDGREHEAVGALETLLESYSDFALAHNDLGVLYYKRGEKERALNCYETAARLEPGNQTFKKNLADFYFVEQGRVEDALQIYVKVLESDPEDVETLMIVGHICVALHKFEDAETFYNRLLAVEPWNIEARENLEKLARRPQTVSSETSPEEQYKQIQTLLQSSNGEAVGLLENLLRSHPQFAPAHNDLGVLYYKQGNKEKALNHYEQAVQIEPQNLNFQKNLADFYFVESGRIKDALSIYKQVLEIDPADVEALMSLGLICASLERHEDARHFYNRVLENEPWNADARQQLENLDRS